MRKQKVLYLKTPSAHPSGRCLLSMYCVTGGGHSSGHSGGCSSPRARELVQTGALADIAAMGGNVGTAISVCRAVSSQPLCPRNGSAAQVLSPQMKDGAVSQQNFICRRRSWARLASAAVVCRCRSERDQKPTQRRSLWCEDSAEERETVAWGGLGWGRSESPEQVLRAEVWGR